MVCHKMPEGEYSKSYVGVKALVLGASGFIGRWIAKALDEQGADVWIVGRKKETLEAVGKECGFNNVRPLAADLSREGEFGRVFHQIRPEIVFNSTGYGICKTENNEADFWKINSELPKEIALTIGGCGQNLWPGMRLIHVGSGFEYGSVAGNVFESTATNPVSLYGRSKLAGTEFIKQASAKDGLMGLAVRIFTVYGPGEHPQRLLPSMMESTGSNRPLELTAGEQERDFTYVKDVAAGILKLGLLDAVPGNLVNLATGRLTSVREFAENAARVLGLEPNQLKFGAIPYRGDELAQGCVDISLLRKLLGWEPAYSITDGITDTLKFERKLNP